MFVISPAVLYFALKTIPPPTPAANEVSSAIITFDLASPDETVVPSMCNVWLGELIQIPTLPDESMRILSDQVIAASAEPDAAVSHW